MPATKSKVGIPNRQVRPGAPKIHQFMAAPVTPIQHAPAGKMRVFSISVLLSVLVLAVYSPVGRHPFIDYDDYLYIVNNAHVKSGLNWDTFKWSLTATEQSNWHPLTWLSHALDCQLFGLNPAGHHWTNLAFHIVNAVLLFLLLLCVTGATWRSLLVASLFALHPLNVESVAWVAERKNLLSTLFFLLTLGAYGWYVRGLQVGRYLLVTLLFAFGLAAKPMLVTLPFVLLLLDYWPLQRVKNWSGPTSVFPVVQLPLSRVVAEKLPLMAMSLGSCIITIVAQNRAVIPTFALPISVRLRTVPYAYAMYLWKMVWPARLALIYPYPGLKLPLWFPLVDGILLVAITVMAWKLRSRRPYVALGWAWFLGMSVPIIGIVQVGDQVVADRYAYLPLIGLFIIVVWGLADLADHLRLSAAVRTVAVVLIAVSLLLVTRQQISYWRGSVDLWQHALQVTRNNSMAEEFLANDLFVEGRPGEAMVHMRNYANLEPLDPLAHVRVGADYQDHGQFAPAIREYETAIRGTVVLNRRGFPGLTSEMLASTYANLAIIHSKIGQQSQAQNEMNRALSTNPAAIDDMTGQLIQSIAANRTAQGYERLGYIMKLIGHEEDAQQAFSWARRMDPRIVLPPGY